MSFKQLKMISHKALVGTMAVWLSGIVFLLCCETLNVRAAEPEFCPLAKVLEHCDKADKNKDSQVVSNQSEQGMDCCAFLPMFFDTTRAIQANQQVAAVAPTAVVEVPRLLSVQANFASTSSYRSTVLLRNNTFLKNRTFRI